MTESSKRHLVLTVTAAFVLLAPGIAFAGGNGGGGKRAGSDKLPTESVGLNYKQTEYKYTEKNTQKNNASPNFLSSKYLTCFILATTSSAVYALYLPLNCSRRNFRAFLAANFRDWRFFSLK